MMRLTAIQRVMDEIHFPKAQIFYRYAKEVMDNEFRVILDSIYCTPRLKQLKKERDILLNEYNHLGMRINDAQANIFNYKEEIVKNTAFIEDGKDEYEQALSSKPSKTFLLFLGIGKNSYNRNIFEWKNNCSSVIEGYKLSQLKLKLDNEELSHNSKMLKNDIVRYDELSIQLRENQSLVVNSIDVNDDVKLKIADHLESYITLLRVAKDIVESKLDDSYVNMVSINNYEQNLLTKDIQGRIKQFKLEIKSKLSIEEVDAMNTLMTINGDQYAADNSKKIVGYNGQDVSSKYQKEDVIALKNAQNKVIDSTLDIMNRWIDLQVTRKTGELASNSYQSQLNIIQEQFKKEIVNIDDVGAVLREVIRKINTAKNHNEIKEGLLMLVDVSGEKLSIRDIDDLLKGDKIIEI